MKQGTEVRINDGSWSLAINGTSLEHVSGSSLVNERYIVLAGDCKLPADRGCSGNETLNNTIVIGIDSGRVVFTQATFLSAVKDDNIVVINGKKWSKDTIAEALKHHAK